MNEHLWVETRVREPASGQRVDAEAPHGARLVAVRYGRIWLSDRDDRVLHYAPVRWRPVGD